MHERRGTTGATRVLLEERDYGLAADDIHPGVDDLGISGEESSRSRALYGRWAAPCPSS
jgi:hypothetical protein